MRKLIVICAFASTLFFLVGITYPERNATHFSDHRLYEQAYRPYVIVTVNTDEEERRGSGFLIKHKENGHCKILAVTNHHVVYGSKAMYAEENVPNLVDAVITVTRAPSTEQEQAPVVLLSEPLRTSRKADLSLLLVPHLSCKGTYVARVATSNTTTKVLDPVVHVTSSGAELGNIEVVPAVVTRFGVDITQEITFSTKLHVVPGMSGSPVFKKTWAGYEVVGVVKQYYGDSAKNIGANYIAPVQNLRTLIGDEN